MLGLAFLPLLFRSYDLSRTGLAAAEPIKSAVWFKLGQALEALNPGISQVLAQGISSTGKNLPVGQAVEAVNRMPGLASAAGAVAQPVVKAGLMKVLMVIGLTAATGLGAFTLVKQMSSKAPAEPASSLVAVEREESTPEPPALESQVPEKPFSLPALKTMDFINNPYLAQRLGTNPAYYYQHPELPMALDFRENEELARSLFVEPTEKGFRLRKRDYINVNQRYFPVNQKRIEPDDSYSAEIVWIQSPEELAEYQSPDAQMMGPSAPRIFTVDDQSYVFKTSITDGVDLFALIQEQDTKAPFIRFAQVVNNPVDDAAQYVVNSAPGTVVENWTGKAMNPEKEFEAIREMLATNPLSFEIQYGLPLLNPFDGYSAEPLEAAQSMDYLPTGNEFFDTAIFPVNLDDERTQSIFSNARYSLGVFDLDSDGKREFLVRGMADIFHLANAYAWDLSFNGYTAIFKETESGLILVNAFNQPMNDSRYLVYSEGKLYNLDHFYLELVDQIGMTERDYYFNIGLDSDGQPTFDLSRVWDNMLKGGPVQEILAKFAGKELFIIDTKLDYSIQSDQLLTMEKMEGWDMAKVIDQIKKTAPTELSLLDQGPEADSLSEDPSAESVDSNQEPKILVQDPGKLDEISREFLEEKDLGPDMYTEYALVDLDQDGYDEFILHVAELSTTLGAPMTQTWEIFLATEQGPDCYYIDYFGGHELIFSNNQFVSMTQSVEDPNTFLVRRQPLQQELNWIGAYAQDYQDYENRMEQATAWSVKDSSALTAEEKKEFADRFLGPGPVIVIPASSNRQDFQANPDRYYPINLLVYPSAEAYLQDPQFLQH